MRRINHVGTVAENLEETLRFFESALDLKSSKKVEKSNLKAAFIRVGGGEIGLLDPQILNFLLRDSFSRNENVYNKYQLREGYLESHGRTREEGNAPN